MFVEVKEKLLMAIFGNLLNKNSLIQEFNIQRISLDGKTRDFDSRLIGSNPVSAANKCLFCIFFTLVVNKKLLRLVNGSNSTSKRTIEVPHINIGFESLGVRQGASWSMVKAFQQDFGVYVFGRLTRAASGPVLKTVGVVETAWGSTPQPSAKYMGESHSGNCCGL